MELFNHLMRWLTDQAMVPLERLSPSVSLLVLSGLMGVVFLLLFRAASDQGAIRSLRRRMAAHLLEFRLFPGSLRIQGSALRGMLIANLKYFRYALRPLLLLAVPLGLVWMHLDQWYGYRPLPPQQTALVSLKLAGDGVDPAAVRLQPGEGVVLAGKPLRIPHEREINWSVRPLRPGKAVLTFRFRQQRVRKQIVVSGGGLARVAAVTPARRFWDALRHPGEAPLPEGSFAERIWVNYPVRTLDLLGWEVSAILYFLIFSSLSALAFMRLLRVQI